MTVGGFRKQNMSGNVLEWVWDHALGGPSRRIRGGSWNGTATCCMVANQDLTNSLDGRRNFIGFRLARSSGL